MVSCPVCDCSNVRTDRCPNCETDLSSIRQLRSLSIVPPSRRLQWLGLGTVGGLILGVTIGGLIGWLLRGWLLRGWS